MQQWLNETLGISTSYQAVYELVRYKLKAKLKVAKCQSTDTAPEQLQQFKAELVSNLTVLQDFCQQHLGMEEYRWRYWCQDETCWSLTTVYRRLITFLPSQLLQNQWRNNWLLTVPPLLAIFFLSVLTV